MGLTVRSPTRQVNRRSVRTKKSLYHIFRPEQTGIDWFGPNSAADHPAARAPGKKEASAKIIVKKRRPFYNLSLYGVPPTCSLSLTRTVSCAKKYSSPPAAAMHRA